MINTILQVAGFVAALVFLVIYYAIAGGQSAWPALFTAAFAVHFAGDWLATLLKPVFTIANFNISSAVRPKAFTQFVGLMLVVAAFFLFMGGHRQVGGGIGFFGIALALTGFLWDVIYP